MLQKSMRTTNELARLSNDNLLTEVKRAAADERLATVQLIALLGEVDARRLYLREGCSSLFTYRTQVLHLSEDAAFFRIEAARAARDYPIVLKMLEEGALTPTVVRLLRPHLTLENHREVLEAARHKSKRDVEVLIAAMRPRPAIPSTVRKLPSPKPAAAAVVSIESPRPNDGDDYPTAAAKSGPEVASVPPPKPAVLEPLAPERYKVQFTISAETHAKLRQVQDLMRHQAPNGAIAPTKRPLPSP